jgi:hypothetical protein
VRKAIKAVSLLTAALFGLLAAVSLYPAPLFAHSAVFGGFTVRSDRRIDPAMASVVADAERRLRTSGLYSLDARFRVFICDEPWRMWLLTRNGGLGAQTDTLATRNIYVRESDAAGNRILLKSGRLADAAERPLSYYLAHEATHVLQSRRFGRLMRLRTPRWLIEGHADLVGKGGDFDLSANRELLEKGDPRLDYHRSRLYRRYHLLVETLLGSGRTIEQLFADPPSEADALAALGAA